MNCYPQFSSQLLSEKLLIYIILFSYLFSSFRSPGDQTTRVSAPLYSFQPGQLSEFIMKRSSVFKHCKGEKHLRSNVSINITPFRQLNSEIEDKFTTVWIRGARITKRRSQWWNGFATAFYARGTKFKAHWGRAEIWVLFHCFIIIRPFPLWLIV